MNSLLCNRDKIEKAIIPYLAQLPKVGIFTEIGIYRGDGVILWKKFLEKNDKQFVYIAVDPFILSGNEDPVQVREEAYRKLASASIPADYIYNQKSQEYWKNPIRAISFLVIDGDHTDTVVRIDCEESKKWLANEAIIVMDDIHCLSKEMRQWVVDFWGTDNIIHIEGPIEQFIIFHGIQI